MMKIKLPKFNLGAIANAIVQFGTPIVLAAVTNKLTTGKLDLKGAAIDAAATALQNAKASRAG